MKKIPNKIYYSGLLSCINVSWTWYSFYTKYLISFHCPGHNYPPFLYCWGIISQGGLTSCRQCTELTNILYDVVFWVERFHLFSYISKYFQHILLAISYNNIQFRISKRAKDKGRKNNLVNDSKHIKLDYIIRFDFKFWFDILVSD